MTIPSGFRQMGLGMMLEIADGEAQAEESHQREQQAKANAYAHVCHAMGTTIRHMTPAQRAMAEATARAWGAGRSEPRGYGFSIPTKDRISR